MSTKTHTYPIDFVVLWVDCSDPAWIAERNKYSNEPMNPARYRDWDVFQYWFRMIEKNAPWVNKVHFVTWGHIPPWLNAQHPKLNIVRHADYIPKEYLPTFSSHTIELNLHRIDEIKEHFVYFNDDMYLAAPCVPEDFFIDGKPCDSAVLAALEPTIVGHPYIHYLCNDASFANAHFTKRAVIKSNLSGWFSPKYGKDAVKNLFYAAVGSFSDFKTFHTAQAYCKSTFEQVWQLEPEALHKTCLNKFRQLTDVSQRVMRHQQLCTGNFMPRSTSVSAYYEAGADDSRIVETMRNHSKKLVCINDTDYAIDFEKEKAFLHDLFESLYPPKSSFEL